MSKENKTEIEDTKNEREDSTSELLNSEEETAASKEPLEENTENKKEEKTKEDLEKELEKTKDKLLRSLAENENTRKQIEKNKIDTAKYGVQPLARELVNILDNFERALNSVGDSTEMKTLEGFLLIQKEIINILDKFNIKKIDALGQPFDANLHQAMFEKPSKDFGQGIVCEIVQDGYKFHDRLLRPAMVGIAKADENNKENLIAEEESSKDDKQSE